MENVTDAFGRDRKFDEAPLFTNCYRCGNEFEEGEDILEISRQTIIRFDEHGYDRISTPDTWSVYSHIECLKHE